MIPDTETNFEGELYRGSNSSKYDPYHNIHKVGNKEVVVCCSLYSSIRYHNL
jgi:hypothetical protein